MISLRWFEQSRREQTDNLGGHHRGRETSYYVSEFDAERYEVHACFSKRCWQVRVIGSLPATTPTSVSNKVS